MSEVKGPAKGRTAGLAKALYGISAVIAVIFVYMVIVNILYMKNYLEAYGMTFSDMWMDTVQYVITGSISYLVYAILIFCAGKVIGMLGCCCQEESAEAPVKAAAEPVEEEAVAEEPETVDEAEAVGGLAEPEAEEEAVAEEPEEAESEKAEEPEEAESEKAEEPEEVADEAAAPDETGEAVGEPTAEPETVDEVADEPEAAAPETKEK